MKKKNTYSLTPMPLQREGMSTLNLIIPVSPLLIYKVAPRLLFMCCFLLSIVFTEAQSNIPTTTIAPPAATARALPFTPSPATQYFRTLMPVMAITDTAKVRFAAPADSMAITTQYADGLGRPLETVVKQGSPLKKDYVSASTYDDLGRQSVTYLPYVATTNNGLFTQNPFKADSIFYKNNFPDEQINYGVNTYDGSPLNRIVKSTAPGNSWTGAGVGMSYSVRANKTADSVRLWTINITGENDIPSTTQSYSAGSLIVEEATNESGIKTVVYKDELGRIVLSKQQISTTVSTKAYTGWLCTYFVYDEMSHLRFVITPKATQALVPLSWNLSGNTAIVKNLCYAYYYDAHGRLISKRLPDKGKIYMAYDSLGRIVLAQDSLLRATSQWQYVKYDGQNRAIKAGLITLSGLSKDTVIARAARSFDYPTLTGTYSVLTEIYYDDYTWVSGSGSGLSSSLSSTDINSTNFITSYNSSPYYAQSITAGKRTRDVVTGIKTAVLGTTDFLFKLNIYDDHLRVIQTQSKNFSTGTDVSTTQYNFTSQPLRNFVRHQKSGTNSQTHTVLTKYTYDRTGGRLTAISKKADGQTEKQIASYAYNELGQMKTQTLGDDLETRNMTYNIRGALRGINKDYAQAATDTSWFGEELSYDYGFTQTRLDGNIAGIKWRSKGDGEQRAYGYAYDAAGRLIKADFSQKNSGWNTSAGVDYSVRNLNYDANGNIISMTQKGLKINSSPIIDSLIYGYAANSNQLLYVTDKANDTSAHLGDFTEINNNTTQDYWYDGNGNFTKDNNKGISSVTYNFLNLPQVITVTGKGTITYTYDATGTKLQKKITEGSRVVTTTYLGGFVYKNDTLQYILNEEGRIRPSAKGLPSLVYDYFIKDHLGNIRMVLTEEKDTSIYPAVTFEDANTATEQVYYDHANLQRTTRPGSFYTSSSNGSKVQLLRKSVQSIGAGKLLKVMAGDKLHIKVDYYIPSATTNNTNANGLNTILNALASVIDDNPATLPLHGSGNTITDNLDNNTTFTDFLAPQNGSAGTSLPKAYLNIVFFDEQFKFVSENSEAVQVSTEGSGQHIYRLGASAKEAAKNGYVYLYVSNESDNLVYFDNLQITHEHGPLLQEDHYYPYGLGMAGISSSAITTAAPNKYKANGGAEYADEEWNNGSGLQMYETFYRSYNAQTGRFMQTDPLAESSMNLSAYTFSTNNPAMFTDFFGDQYKYMDKNGTKWHHADVLAGTAMEGQQYQEGYGVDGFGNDYFAGGGGSGSGRSGYSFDGGPYSFGSDGFSLDGDDAKNFFAGLVNSINNADNNGNWLFMAGTNKNGQFGYWQAYGFTSSPAEGTEILAGVGVGQQFVSLDGDQNKRPSFSLLEANYLGDNYTSPQVYEKIGGKVYQNYLANPEAYANSCALRMSYALNRAGAPIPHITGTGSGADGMWYFYRVADLGKYLNRTYGHPDINGHARSDFNGVHGIIQFDVSIWTNATGHFTTWDGSQVGHGDYFKESDDVHLWILP
jgi:RHS repeat-associated protein